VTSDPDFEVMTFLEVEYLCIQMYSMYRCTSIQCTVFEIFVNVLKVKVSIAQEESISNIME